MQRDMAYKTGIFSSYNSSSATATASTGGLPQASSTLSSQFQLISDDESLEDHSGLEDFQGVTLEINSFSESATPEPENNGGHPPHSQTHSHQPHFTSSSDKTNIDSTTNIKSNNVESRERVSSLPFLPSSSIINKNFNSNSNHNSSPTATTTTTTSGTKPNSYHPSSMFPGGGASGSVGAYGSSSNSAGGGGAVTPTTSVPRISITPMTPPSGSLSPDDDDDDGNISLNSSDAGSSMYRHHHRHGRKYRNVCKNRSGGGGVGGGVGSYWRPQSPMPPANEHEARDFFAYRDSIIQNAIEEVQSIADSSLDGIVRGTFLFTEIDHWNNELERLVLLCSKSLIIVKYDFIAMKQEEYRRIHLCVIDKIIQGELKYPDNSLTPRLSGIAGGIVGVVKDCIIPKVQNVPSFLYRNKKNKTVYNDENASASSISGGAPASPQPDNPLSNDGVQKELESQDFQGAGGDVNATKTSIMSALSLENFEPRARNAQGIRIMWNQDLPLSFAMKWNPFNKSIPYVTFVSHPLLYVHKGAGGGINRSFDIDCFAREFIDILSDSSGGDSSPVCRIEFKPLIIESYVGLTSIFHNANELGFYKVRGRVSF